MHKLTHATYIRVPRAEKRVNKGKHALQRHSRGKQVAFFWTPNINYWERCLIGAFANNGLNPDMFEELAKLQDYGKDAHMRCPVYF